MGKYTQLHDAYLSVVEALKHGGISCRTKVELTWVDSEELNEKNLDQTLHAVDGILVPGGFGNRGTEGMILAARYARVHRIPYLGICLGMQMAIVEFARHVLGYVDANSIELDPATKHPVIALMPDQESVEDIGGTLRLGSYPCVLADGSRAIALFGKKEIQERHRHRYEVNNAFRKELSDNGMTIAGTSPDGHIVEMIEIRDHPFLREPRAIRNSNPVPTTRIRCSADSWEPRQSTEKQEPTQNAGRRMKQKPDAAGEKTRSI